MVNGVDLRLALVLGGKGATLRRLHVLDAAPLEGHALVDGVGCAMLKGVPEGPKFIGKGGCALVQGAADGPSPIDGVGCVLAEGSTFIYLEPRPRPSACGWGGLFLMLAVILWHT